MRARPLAHAPRGRHPPFLLSRLARGEYIRASSRSPPTPALVPSSPIQTRRRRPRSRPPPPLPSPMNLFAPTHKTQLYAPPSIRSLHLSLERHCGDGVPLSAVLKLPGDKQAIAKSTFLHAYTPVRLSACLPSCLPALAAHQTVHPQGRTGRGGRFQPGLPRIRLRWRGQFERNGTVVDGWADGDRTDQAARPGPSPTPVIKQC